MAGFKDSISKGLTAFNVKTNNFMEENKLKTHINTLESECNELFKAIGEQLYNDWKKGEASIDSVTEKLELIKDKQNQIADEQKNIDDLQKVEEAILGKKNATEATSNVFCASCGAENASNYKFCVKCGKPLS